MCEAVVRALVDDADLRRIEADGQLELLVSRTGELAGAQSAEAIVRAERLSRIAGLVRAATLRGVGSGSGSASGATPGTHLRPLPDPAPSGRTASPGVEHGPPVVPDRPPMPGGPAPTPTPTPTTVDESVWVGVLDRELTRAQRSGSPLSLLLLELEEADRVIAVEPPGEAAATFGRFAQTVRGVMRRQDILACETYARAWIIARDTGRAGAQALAARTAGSVRMAQAWRGAPLTVSIGLAVLGEDGTDTDELVDSAERARLAAAAEGVGLFRSAPGGGGAGAGFGADPEGSEGA